MRRFILPFFILTLCLTGLALTADALVTTSEERLDRIVEDVSAPGLEDRVDGALSHVNPSGLPFRLATDGQVREYSAGDQTRSSTAVRAALSVFDTEQQELLQRSVDIHADEARIVTRIGDAEYEQTVIYDLMVVEGTWTIRSIRAL